MRRCHKILLIILLIIVIVLIWAILTLELPRYHRMKKRETLIELDRTFKERHQFCKRKYPDNIVISMSTIPDRIDLLGPTLASWMDQTVLPDEIAINVPHVSRKGLPYHIPKWLKSLKSVTIHRVDKDEGPGTKLLPTLRREKKDGVDTKIIVGDDDNIYNSKIIETLMKTHYHWMKMGHHVAVTNYGVSLDCKGNLPSIPERTRVAFTGMCEVDLLQGFSGFLVTPQLFKSKEVYDLSNGPPEAISVDDVWFSGWLRKDKRKIVTPGCAVLHAPIVASGAIRQTPALAHGENKNFVTDLKVIRWFIDEHHVRPVACCDK